MSRACRSHLLWSVLALSSLAWGATARVAAVDGQRIANADAEPQNWMSHGRTYGEERFSPLRQIDRDSVGRLGPVWSFATGTRRGMEATPIVVDGVMYVSTAWSRVYALDAATGTKLWHFDPEVPGEVGRKACCDVVNRGVALWKGKIYLGALDGRLIALDARDGTVVWETLTVDPGKHYTITGAPRVVKDKVIIGNGGAEFGVRGYFSAYDADTGELAWRFYTVPAAPGEPFEHLELQMAATTWSPDSRWETGLGGTVWDSFAYDPELNLLYVGVGNSSQYNRAVRSPGGGDNLFLASILAVDPDTGRLVWHYQTTPAEAWDYTATQHMILTDLSVGGRDRKVLMQAPKNGFFYVLDRQTGEFISAKNFVPVNWASHIDPETGRPVETGKGDWSTDSAVVMPGPVGGHNWHPMSYSPLTGLVYIPTLEMIYPFIPDKDYTFVEGRLNTGEDWPALFGTTPPVEISFCSPTQLTAWDPVSQQPAWQVAFDSQVNAGVLSTAGRLVFQGTSDGRLVAYADDSGEVLWESSVDVGIMAPPVSYGVDGKQYVAVVAGLGGAAGLHFGKYDDINPGYVFAFALDGKAALPRIEKRVEREPEIDGFEIAQADVDHGLDLYAVHCGRCHGSGDKSSGLIVDLRQSPREVHEVWPAIVLGGAYKARGMASFADLLSQEDVRDIHAYVLTEAAQSPSLLMRAVNAVTSSICIPPTWLAD